MFEKFTNKATKAIMLAQEEARRLGHNFLGNEQLLLGLIGEGTGIAYQVLKIFGINLANTRIEVEKRIGRGSGFVSVQIPYTPRAKIVLKLALEEARKLKHNYLGTEHILLGIISEGEGVAVRVIENLGVNLEELCKSIHVVLENGIRESKLEERYRDDYSELINKISRLRGIFEDDRSPEMDLEDRLDRELNKRSALDRDIAEVLNSLRSSYSQEKSQLQEFIIELQIAIATNDKLSSKAKKSALEMVLTIVEAFQDFQDDRQQKLAASAFKILQWIIDEIPNSSELLKNIQYTLSKTSLRIKNYKRSSKQSIKSRNLAMFERFTEQSIKVIMLAQEESRRLGHNFVGTEQMLIGIIGEQTGIAAKVLKSFNVNLENARVEVEKTIGRGAGFVAVEIPFTPRAKRVLELALEEVRQLKEHYIDTEHLLLGLIRLEEGIAVRVIKELGVSLKELCDRVIQEISKTGRQKLQEEIQEKDENSDSLIQLSWQVDRSIDILEIVKNETSKIGDRIKEEIDKRSILDSDFADALDRLPESSSIKELLTHLKAAIQADNNLSIEDKEEAIEVVNFLAQAGQKPTDKEVQKYARTALKILRGTIVELPEDSQLVGECREILPKILEGFSTKEYTEEIKELLHRLKTAIETDNNLISEDKEEALEQVTILEQICLRPQSKDVKKYARTALKILRGTIIELPEDSQLVGECKQILPEISKIFGL